MKNEKAILTGYLTHNPNITSYDSVFLKNKLKLFLDNLTLFESPDIYGKINNEILILEHFEFDGSEENKEENGKIIKGMDGVAKEYKAIKEFKQFDRENDRGELVLPMNYYQTVENYIKNFTKHFNNHYKKINKYIENLKDKKIVDNETVIYTGFFIENKIPPIFNNYGDIEEINLLTTKQFIEVFDDSQLLDIVLFGGLFNEKPRLFYIDRSLIGNHKSDLRDLDNIEFLRLSEVQMVWKNSSY